VRYFQIVRMIYKGGAYSTKRLTLVKTVYGNYCWMSLCKVLSALVKEEG